mgnify:CR=1 FL=1
MFFSGARLTLTLDAGSRLVPASFGRVETHNPRLTSRPFAALTITPVTDFSAIPVERGGAAVKVQRVSLGPLAPEVRQVLRGYDTRQAPASLHLVMLNAAGAVTSVEEAFKGVIDRFEINEGPIDDAGNSTVTCDVELVSDARMLTRTLSLKQSDASQRLRSAGDGFRKYADVAGEVSVNWMGETDSPHKAREIRRAR